MLAGGAALTVIGVGLAGLGLARKNLLPGVAGVGLAGGGGYVLYQELKEAAPPPEPVISFDPSRLEFEAELGGALPAAQMLTVWNSGLEELMAYTLVPSQTYIRVTPETGSSTGDRIKHTVSVDITGLVEGEYEQSIAIQSPAAKNKVVPVKISIVMPPSAFSIMSLTVAA